MFERHWKSGKDAKGIFRQKKNGIPQSIPFFAKAEGFSYGLLDHVSRPGQRHNLTKPRHRLGSSFRHSG